MKNMKTLKNSQTLKLSKTCKNLQNLLNMSKKAESNSVTDQQTDRRMDQQSDL